MVTRRRFILFATTMLVAVIIALWVRSYWFADSFFYRFAQSDTDPVVQRYVAIESRAGGIELRVSTISLLRKDWDFHHRGELFKPAGFGHYIPDEPRYYVRDYFFTEPPRGILYRLGFQHFAGYVDGGERRDWNLVVFPYWVLPALIVAPPLLIRARRAIVRSRRAKRGVCRMCGYDLRNIASCRCPECGEKVNRAPAAELSVVPS